jgi:hypothetical protein
MEVVYAKDSAVVPLDNGGRVMVRKGTHWPANDPIVKTQPSLFSTDPSYGLSYTADPEPVEQATAAPGEKRNVRRAG